MRKGDQTRSLILDGAAALASELGLEGLSIGTLATRLGLSKSGLFAHFGSKEDLQLQTLKRVQDQFEERVFRPAMEAPRGVARLRALFQNWLAWTQKNLQPGSCVILSAAGEYDGRPGPIRDFLVSGQKELRGAIAKAVRIAIEEGEIRADADPWQVAYELFAVVLAAHYDRHLLEDARASDRAARAFDRVLAAYAVAPKSQ
jgi:AcrR family transcriptional regulator